MSRPTVDPDVAVEEACTAAVAAIHAWHAAAQRAGLGGAELDVALRMTRAAVKVGTEHLARSKATRQPEAFAGFAADKWGSA